MSDLTTILFGTFVPPKTTQNTIIHRMSKDDRLPNVYNYSQGPKQAVLGALSNGRWKSPAKVAKDAGYSRTTVNRILVDMIDTGEAVRRKADCRFGTSYEYKINGA